MVLLDWGYIVRKAFLQEVTTTNLITSPKRNASGNLSGSKIMSNASQNANGNAPLTHFIPLVHFHTP